MFRILPMVLTLNNMQGVELSHHKQQYLVILFQQPMQHFQVVLHIYQFHSFLKVNKLHIKMYHHSLLQISKRQSMYHYGKALLELLKLCIYHLLNIIKVLRMLLHLNHHVLFKDKIIGFVENGTLIYQAGNGLLQLYSHQINI